MIFLCICHEIVLDFNRVNPSNFPIFSPKLLSVLRCTLPFVTKADRNLGRSGRESPNTKVICIKSSLISLNLVLYSIN